MKKIQRVFAVLLAAALLSGCSISAQQMLLLSSVESTKFIGKIETPTSTPQPTATPKPTSTPQPTAAPKPTSTPQPSAAPTPTSTPKPTATPFVRTGKSEIILISGGEEQSYTVDQMRSELGGKPVLLRNSCIDTQLDCDLSFLYEVIDFAVLKGTTTAILPLTKEEYAEVRSRLNYMELFSIMYPQLDWLKITTTPESGFYRISFSFLKYGNGTDAEIAKQYVQARYVALDVVENMPAFSKKNQTTKLFYLYSYITHFVKYTEGSYWINGRGNCPLYDALIKRDTVCAGFAYAFAYLCELAGIDAQWVHVYNSRNDDGHHAVVIAEGRYGFSHWFDPTWDEGENMTGAGFEYFGTSDSDLFFHHSGVYTTAYPRTYYPSNTKSGLGISPVDRTNSSWYYWDFDTMKLRGIVPYSDQIKAGRYCISSKMDQNVVLEISGSSKEKDANAQIWFNDFSDNKKFDLIKDGDGFVFKNCNSKLVLDVEQAQAVSGANVMQYEKHGGPNQRWIVKPCGDKDYHNGYCYIVSDLGKRDLYLEVDGDSAVGGANVRIASFTGKDNQKWRFTDLNKTSLGEGRYTITSALDNNRALTVDFFNRKEGANAQIYYLQSPDYSGVTFQKFDVCKVPDGYCLKCNGSELVLSIESSNSPTKNVVQKAYKSSSTQKWTMTSAGNGTFYIKSNAGYYLEVSGSSTADGTNVQAAAFTGKDNQKWRFNLLIGLDVFS